MPPLSAAPEQLTLPSVQRDFVEWRRGRAHYAVWALNVDGAELAMRSARLRAAFVRQLLPDYCRQPHITVQLCGFPVAQPSLVDDFGVADLATHLAGLKAARVAPFAIELGHLASFTSAAYFAVSDPAGGIASLRRALRPPEAEDDIPYVPHVSFALYRCAVPLLGLLQEMRAVAGDAIHRLEIKRLSLMCYRASLIGGPLSTLAEFDLRKGCLEVRAPAQMGKLFGAGWQEFIFA